MEVKQVFNSFKNFVLPERKKGDIQIKKSQSQMWSLKTLLLPKKMSLEIATPTSTHSPREGYSLTICQLLEGWRRLNLDRGGGVSQTCKHTSNLNSDYGNKHVLGYLLQKIPE